VRLVDSSEIGQLDLKVLAADWAWLFNAAEYALLDISPFGDLFLKDKTGALCVLDVNLGVLEYAQEDGSDPASLFPELFDGRLAEAYRKAQLCLSSGACYGYKIQLVTGGSLSLENVYIASLTEYVSFMGCFHFQINDVPDSGQVKIVRHRPN
jgi:hypothetical protein